MNQTGAAIPIGIAVGRQRLQESNQAAQQLQAKDLNRFGLSMADLGEFDIKKTIVNIE